jgi:trehalose synthase
MPLAADIVRTVLERQGIDPERPYVCQVSPCDAASDLPGALEAVQQAARVHAGLQMAFVLTTEPQDQASRASYEELARRCREEPDVRVLPAGNEIGNAEINVFQRGATAVIQKGLRKGFGLWVSDALWKERPCVVAPAPGLLEQVIDGETGLVARTTGEFASAIGSLLDDPATAARYGERGRRLVGERFLITRYLRDYLQVLHDSQKAN